MESTEKLNKLVLHSESELSDGELLHILGGFSDQALLTKEDEKDCGCSCQPGCSNGCAPGCVYKK
ncbi:MAG: hypothetical protein LBC98_05620 [Prevotellaceae bacterium]|jgi:hypothetical protein|nr:hypothetical protein [Prevotellaceae bacterium]